MFCPGAGRWWNLSWDQPSGLQVWFSERQVEILNKNKRIYLSQRRRREPLKTESKNRNEAALNVWWIASLHYPFIHLSSLFFIVFYFELWTQSYFTPGFELLFPLLYRHSYPQLFITDSNICCKHKDLYAGIGGIKRYKRKESVTPYCPVSWSQHSRSSIKSNRVTVWV